MLSCGEFHIIMSVPFLAARVQILRPSLLTSHGITMIGAEDLVFAYFKGLNK